ncbi:PREDICTED: probable ATP-dependent RNA helicase ddx42 [Wasmannia auropunctata]|uniref:probable ATP-dependent RNA helicase ddx42 n=1 Tax=Wasmannia auropunctata TaxID=64793 RepID=UPI0005EE2766|nr:PREDICTED: probable ATP-dependent RNA helicase ddx42 [Wasmannia auropunctata]
MTATAQQLPWRAREALAGADFENAQTVVTRLQYLDLNPLDKTGEKETENKGKSENNQIRNLTVKESKNNDGKENAKSFNQNKVYRREDSTYNNYNQRNGYKNYGYERDNRQYGRNGSNYGDPQVGDCNRQMENQQGYYNRANVHDMRSRAISQPWRRNSQMPFASSNNRYVNIGDNNNTNLTDVSQPSMNYQNTNNRQHLN